MNKGRQDPHRRVSRHSEFRTRSFDGKQRINYVNPESIIYESAATMDGRTNGIVPTENLTGFHLINVSSFYIVFVHLVFREPLDGIEGDGKRQFYKAIIFYKYLPIIFFLKKILTLSSQ
jgi:hypothetical protein